MEDNQTSGRVGQPECERPFDFAATTFPIGEKEKFVSAQSLIR
jgi:hypothetical protein